MMKRILPLAALLLPALASAAAPVSAGKHNLSVSGPGTVKAQSEPRTCVFCHVAHSGREGGGNRPDSPVRHQVYGSTTLTARQPAVVGGASRSCLSCHDGTIALGQTVKGSPIRMRGTGAGDRMPEGKANLGFDLSGSHPVSFEPQAGGKTRGPHP
jgi:hypothetical protein